MTPIRPLKDVKEGKISRLQAMSMAARTYGHAPGAIPNGTLVEKVGSDDSDAHRDAARARVVGSIGPVDFPEVGKAYGYWVEWEDLPGIPTFIASNRIRRVSG